MSCQEGSPEHRTIMKCPGVKASTLSSSNGNGANGRLFIQTSICVRTVSNHTLEVGLEAFHCSFPKAAEVGGTLRNEFPLDCLCNQRFRLGFSVTPETEQAPLSLDRHRLNLCHCHSTPKLVDRVLDKTHKRCSGQV